MVLIMTRTYMKTPLSVILTAILILNFTCIYGQDTPPENPMLGSGQEQSESTSLKDRFFFGGSLGLQFGSATYIDISPLVGYKITEKLHGGVGLTYIYYKVKDTYYNYAYETSIYGGRVFGRYYILDNLFAHTEFEILNMDVPAEIAGTNNFNYVRENVTSLMVGGGYNQSIGANAALQLMILWNLTEEQYSPYLNPIFRIGFVAGF